MNATPVPESEDTFPNTIERGKLWMLQTRVGKRTAAAAFRIAGQLVDEQLITLDEALSRVSGAQLAQLMFPQFDSSAERNLLTTAMAASPGAAVGRIVFDSPTWTVTPFVVDDQSNSENAIGTSSVMTGSVL